MRKIAVLAVVASVAACQPKDNSSVGQLIAKKDSLKQEYKNLAKEIKSLEKEIEKKDTTIDIRKVLVSTTKIEPSDFEHYFEVHGVVTSDKTINIVAEVQGAVEKVLVGTGSNVSKGQTLLVIDTDILQKNIEEVKSQYELAKTLFEKQEKLWEQKIGSEVQYLQAKTNKESLEKKMGSLQSQINKSVVKAPFSGVVDEVFPKEGEIVGPQMPLVRLVNLNQTYIECDISEEYVTKVRKGNGAKVNFSSIQDKWLDAKVTKVGQFVNPNNRTFRVQVDLSDKVDYLKPNLLGVVKIRDYSVEKAMVVPSSVIQQDGVGENYLYVVHAGDLAKKIDVKVGASYMGKTEVLEGLSAGQQIIVEGARSVKEGETIAIKN